MANLITTLFALWCWTIHGAQLYPNSPPPLGAVLLLAVTVISFATLIWDTPPSTAGSPPSRRRALGRSAFVTALTAALVTMICVAFLPIYRHRQTIVELESLGFDWESGRVSRWARKLRHFLPVYEYLADVDALRMRNRQSVGAADAERVGKLLKRLPALSSLSVLNISAGGGRLLRPLKGYRSLTELSLAGPGVTDETLIDVAALPSLRTLNVPNSSVTAEGIARVRRVVPSAYFGGLLNRVPGAASAPIPSAGPAANAAVPSSASPTTAESDADSEVD